MSTRLYMKQHDYPGKLITFCGLDGCGKSTMIEMLREDLSNSGCDVLITKQPTDSMRTTDIFRSYMDSPDHGKNRYRALSLMAAADRIQHINQMILPALREGKIVICDRYIYSCLANLRARGYEEDDWIYEISREEIPAPDLAFFLEVPVDTAVARVRERPQEKDRYIDMGLQYRLYEQYRKICRENDGVLISSDTDKLLTYSKLLKYVEKHLGGHKNG